MSLPRIEVLTPEEILQIHTTSLRILEKVGIVVHHKEVLTRTSRNQTGKRRGKVAQQDGSRKAPYISQRLENEVSIKLPQEEVATFPQKYFSTRDIKLILRI